jgi:hypothetical protein
MGYLEVGHDFEERQAELGILPCPLCSHEAHCMQSASHSWLNAVYCTNRNCGIQVQSQRDGWAFEPREELIARWNGLPREIRGTQAPGTEPSNES